MSHILITGGASGLGEEITRKFAQKEEDKIFFTFNRSHNQAMALTAEFSNVESIKCDFSQTCEVAFLVDKINEINPDILINNAYTGDFIKTYFHKISSQDFLTDFRINIIPTIEVTQAAITCFRKKKKGKIITVLTSALFSKPPVGAAAYVANKAYLAELVKVWANENAKYNITSNSVSPSFMQTPFTASTDERLIEQMTAEHPLKQLLTTQEVADTIVFLANSSPQINGIDILINAGR